MANYRFRQPDDRRVAAQWRATHGHYSLGNQTAIAYAQRSDPTYDRTNRLHVSGGYSPR